MSNDDKYVTATDIIQPQSDFERGLYSSQLLVYRMLQMIGNGTVQPNTKHGSALGADKLREWVDAADRELGL